MQIAKIGALSPKKRPQSPPRSRRKRQGPQIPPATALPAPPLPLWRPNPPRRQLWTTQREPRPPFPSPLFPSASRTKHQHTPPEIMIRQTKPTRPVAKIPRSTAAVPAPSPGAMSDMDDLLSRAADTARKSRAESTQRSYDSILRIFAKFAVERGQTVFPADARTVAAFLLSPARRARRFWRRH